MTRPEFEPFWQSVRQGVLRFPFCPSCSRFHWYPQIYCPHCQNQQVEWQAVKGTASVFSWSVVRHAFSEEFASRLPYVIVLLEFDDAPAVRLISTLDAEDASLISIGVPVEPVFPVAPEQLLTFRLLRQ